MAALIASYTQNESNLQDKEAELQNKATKECLMIFFDNKYYKQVLDSFNTVWEFEVIDYIQDIIPIINKYSNIKTIALVHHGHRYCKNGTREALEHYLFLRMNIMQKLVDGIIVPLKDIGFKLSHDTYSKNSDLDFDNNIKLSANGGFESTLENDDFTLNYEDYMKLLSCCLSKKWVFDSSESSINIKKELENQIIIYTYMSLLLNFINNDGYYISVACNEGENELGINFLGTLIENNLTIYSNCNPSSIYRTLTIANPDNLDAKGKPIPYKGYEDLGSFFRIPLTSKDNIINKSGWIKNNVQNGVSSISHTGKDMILNNLKDQGDLPFRLIEFNSYSENEIEEIMKAHSMRFKKLAEKNWKWNHKQYQEWKSKIRKR